MGCSTNAPTSNTKQDSNRESGAHMYTQAHNRRCTCQVNFETERKRTQTEFQHSFTTPHSRLPRRCPEMILETCNSLRYHPAALSAVARRGVGGPAHQHRHRSRWLTCWCRMDPPSSCACTQLCTAAGHLPAPHLLADRGGWGLAHESCWTGGTPVGAVQRVRFSTGVVYGRNQG